MKQLFVILLAALLVQGCAGTEENKNETPKANRLNEVSWLLGSWVIETPEAIITESWEQQSDSEYNSVSVVRDTSGDTVYTERIRVIVKNDTLWYLPAVSNQNDGKEVAFKQTSLFANKIVFENPAHDYPQRIVYERTSDTTLFAYVEGIKNGQQRREDYPFRKK